MPRKKCDIRRDYRRAGFTERHGKGGHVVFTHLLLRDNFSVDGADGDDAKPYDERDLKRGLAEFERARQQHNP